MTKRKQRNVDRLGRRYCDQTAGDQQCPMARGGRWRGKQMFYPCVLVEGHGGPHAANDGTTWEGPSPHWR